MNRFTALLAGAAAVALASPAHATLQFSADIGGNTFSCVDNTACDSNPATGTIVSGTQSFANGSGTITFLGSAQTSTQGSSNSLDTTSFQINNTGPAITVQIAVGDNGFVGPVTTLSESGSGTFQNAAGSTIRLTYYADPTNTQGAGTPTDTPGILQADSGVITAGPLTDSFNFNATSAFSDPDLYSMTLATVGTLAAGTAGTPSQLTGRSQAIVAEQVPEPGSLLILGSALVGFGWFKRRRNRLNRNGLQRRGYCPV